MWTLNRRHTIFCFPYHIATDPSVAFDTLKYSTKIKDNLRVDRFPFQIALPLHCQISYNNHDFEFRYPIDIWKQAFCHPIDKW